MGQLYMTFKFAKLHKKKKINQVFMSCIQAFSLIWKLRRCKN